MNKRQLLQAIERMPNEAEVEIALVAPCDGCGGTGQQGLGPSDDETMEPCADCDGKGFRLSFVAIDLVEFVGGKVRVRIKPL